MENKMMTEVREAQKAGTQALQSLYAAQEKLEHARIWGIWDMLGGGFFVDMIKHSRLKDASVYLEVAKADLNVFRRELKNVEGPLDLRLDISGFLVFADFFFDGLIADYLVQSRIADAREQVADAIRRVEHILKELEQYS